MNTPNTPNTPKKLVVSALALSFVLMALPALAGEVVNINTADANTLARLPRVGPSLAARIVDHREDNGKFEDVEDLMLVSGIGEKTFEMLRHWVTTSGETTLKSKVSMRQALERVILADAEKKKEAPAEKPKSKAKDGNGSADANSGGGAVR